MEHLKHLHAVGMSMFAVDCITVDLLDPWPNALQTLSDLMDILQWPAVGLMGTLLLSGQQACFCFIILYSFIT